MTFEGPDLQETDVGYDREQVTSSEWVVSPGSIVPANYYRQLDFNENAMEYTLPKNVNGQDDIDIFIRNNQARSVERRGGVTIFRGEHPPFIEEILPDYESLLETHNVAPNGVRYNGRIVNFDKYNKILERLGIKSTEPQFIEESLRSRGFEIRVEDNNIGEKAYTEIGMVNEGTTLTEEIDHIYRTFSVFYCGGRIFTARVDIGRWGQNSSNLMFRLTPETKEYLHSIGINKETRVGEIGRVVSSSAYAQILKGIPEAFEAAKNGDLAQGWYLEPVPKFESMMAQTLVFWHIENEFRKHGVELALSNFAVKGETHPRFPGSNGSTLVIGGASKMFKAVMELGGTRNQTFAVDWKSEVVNSDGFPFEDYAKKHPNISIGFIPISIRTQYGNQPRWRNYLERVQSSHES